MKNNNDFWGLDHEYNGSLSVQVLNLLKAFVKKDCPFTEFNYADVYNRLEDGIAPFDAGTGETSSLSDFKGRHYAIAGQDKSETNHKSIASQDHIESWKPAYTLQQRAFERPFTLLNPMVIMQYTAPIYRRIAT